MLNITNKYITYLNASPPITHTQRYILRISIGIQTHSGNGGVFHYCLYKGALQNLDIKTERNRRVLFQATLAPLDTVALGELMACDRKLVDLLHQARPEERAQSSRGNRRTLSERPRVRI